MRGEPQGNHRSVDRGTRRLGIELRHNRDRSADVVPHGGRQHRRLRYREQPADSAQSKTPSMHGNSTRENRGEPSDARRGTAAGRLEKALSQKSNMHVAGESDGRILPAKCPNNGEQAPAEGMEGRRPTKENIEQATPPRTQSRISELSDLFGVREVARRDKRTRFTALLHHVTTELLRDSYYALRRDAAPGVDGVTWQEYETDLDEKLADLHRRINRGTYRAQPSKRAYIAKADGRQRPWASPPWSIRSFSTRCEGAQPASATPRSTNSANPRSYPHSSGRPAIKSICAFKARTARADSCATPSRRNGSSICTQNARFNRSRKAWRCSQRG